MADLPSDMSSGSRELLLLLGWMMCREKLISKFIDSRTEALNEDTMHLYRVSSCISNSFTVLLLAIFARVFVNIVLGGWTIIAASADENLRSKTCRGVRSPATTRCSKQQAPAEPEKSICLADGEECFTSQGNASNITYTNTKWHKKCSLRDFLQVLSFIFIQK